MSPPLRNAARAAGAVAALGALALGGSAIAGAASKSGERSRNAGPGFGYGPPPGHHRGFRRPAELTGETAEKVEKAALARLPGATVEHSVESPRGDGYAAFVRKSDGSRAIVLVNEQFEATRVIEHRRPGRGHGPGGRGDCPDKPGDDRDDSGAGFPGPPPDVQMQ